MIHFIFMGTEEKQRNYGFLSVRRVDQRLL